MNKMREALESAIEVTESLAKQLDSDELWTHLAMLKETLAAEPEPAGEPVAHIIGTPYCQEIAFLPHGPSTSVGDILYKGSAPSNPTPEAVRKLVEAADLALEYWSHRMQRYKNKSPVWVQDIKAALAEVRAMGVK